MYFYSEENDVSLFQMIKKMATTALSLCEIDDCKKIRLIHTDYFYHNNGCVEIKYKEDTSDGYTMSPSPDMWNEDFTVSVFCFCNQCKVTVMNITEVPTQMLEMSFYKLLE